MSRKKHDIPQEPVIPTPEQILEDVMNSPDDDCVFHLLKADGDSTEESVKSNNTNTTFEKVRAFVEMHENMRLCLQQLKDKSKSLKISDCELKAMVDDIRKQSIEALQ